MRISLPSRRLRNDVFSGLEGNTVWPARDEFKALVAAIADRDPPSGSIDLQRLRQRVPTAVAIWCACPGQLTVKRSTAGLVYERRGNMSASVTSMADANGCAARFTAALPASFRWNPHLITLYKRLIAAGRDRRSSPCQKAVFSQRRRRTGIRGP